MFIVYSPEGEAPPRIHHKSHKAAFHQAHRLAKSNPGRRFFVMKMASNQIMVPADAKDCQTEAEEALTKRLGDDLGGEV